MTDALTVETNARGVARVTLNRPDIRNAFDADLIRAVKEAFDRLSTDDTVRVIVLAGEGAAFSAGADLSYMQEMAGYSEAENEADAQRLSDMFAAIASSPKPVIARVHGAAIGGGVGLVAAADIAIGTTSAIFALTEVKLGLIPAAISPFVVRAIGPRAASRYFLTGEKIDADEAYRIGLLHAVVDEDELDVSVATISAALAANGPIALGEAKDLIRLVEDAPITDDLRAETAKRIARIRVSDEGREGLAAFFDKRKPGWTQ